MIINNIFKCTQDEFDNSKSRDLILLNCIYCNNTYKRSKKNILDAFKKHNTYPKYCSQKCNANSRKENQTVKTFCKNCNNEVIKLLNQYNRSSNHFCSQSCCGTYSNKNKTKGIRRSKFEVYIENKLTELYSNLEIVYSDKITIRIRA